MPSEEGRPRRPPKRGRGRIYDTCQCVLRNLGLLRGKLPSLGRKRITHHRPPSIRNSERRVRHPFLSRGTFLARLVNASLPLALLTEFYTTNLSVAAFPFEPLRRPPEPQRFAAPLNGRTDGPRRKRRGRAFRATVLGRAKGGSAGRRSACPTLSAPHLAHTLRERERMAVGSWNGNLENWQNLAHLKQLTPPQFE